jgi:CHAD domain-containing protein
MAYRFKLREPFGAGLVRIGLEQIRIAAEGLAAPGDATAIHETRKCLKRLRALLRIARPGLRAADFRRENARFREIANLLSGARDLHVLMQTLSKLAARHNLEKARPLVRLTDALLAKQQQASQSVDASKMAQARRLLRQAARDFGSIRLRPNNFEPIGAGLVKSYRGCRAAFGEAYDGRSDEAFHEWRKSVQQHWRHMRLLSRAWPDYFAARVKAARELSDILGEDHDYCMLKSFLGAEARPLLQRRESARLEGLCRARQKELRAAARPRGMRLLAEGPRGLTRRIECFWQAASQIPDEPAEPGGDSDLKGAEPEGGRKAGRKRTPKEMSGARGSAGPKPLA